MPLQDILRPRETFGDCLSTYRLIRFWLNPLFNSFSHFLLQKNILKHKKKKTKSWWLLYSYKIVDWNAFQARIFSTYIPEKSPGTNLPPPWIIVSWWYFIRYSLWYFAFQWNTWPLLTPWVCAMRPEPSPHVGILINLHFKNIWKETLVLLITITNLSPHTVNIIERNIINSHTYQ